MTKFSAPKNFARLVIQRLGGIVVGWLLKLGRAAAMLAGVIYDASFDAFINASFAGKGFICMTMPRAIFSFAELDMNALEGQSKDSQGNSLKCSGIGSADPLSSLTSLLAHSNLPKILGRDRYRRDGQAGLSSTALCSLILRDVFSRIHIRPNRERMWWFLSQARLGLKVILSHSKDRLVHAVPLVNRSFVPGCLFRRGQADLFWLFFVQRPARCGQGLVRLVSSSSLYLKGLCTYEKSARISLCRFHQCSFHSFQEGDCLHDSRLTSGPTGPWSACCMCGFSQASGD